MATFNSYRGFRFPAEVIQQAVWLYHCFSLSLRDVETILAARGIVVSYESIREWGLRASSSCLATAATRHTGRRGHADGYPRAATPVISAQVWKALVRVAR